jgi:DNA-binding FadR family transcriptional regulator
MAASLASETVHADLREAILSGKLKRGDAVPSERELSERLGVNRHAVREAVKRLQQARLVQVSQGGATRVLDWRQTGGLDLLLDIALAREGAIDADTLRAIGEMRACIGSDAARLCAQRAPAGARNQIAELADTVAEELTEEANERMWDAIVDGSGNLAYRLGLNTLLAGMQQLPEFAAELRPAKADVEHLEGLAAALRAGDGDGAAAAARPQLERPLEALRDHPKTPRARRAAPRRG